MGDFTQNLQLEKPYQAEQYNVDVFNSNFQKIDDFAGLTPANALTADKLRVPVNINGVSFRGDEDVVTGLGMYFDTVNYAENKLAYKVINDEVIIKRSKIDNNLGNDFDDDEYWEEVELGGSGSGHNVFDIVYKDHILSYEETKGFALLGSYVYKDAIAGSRYGYPNFYNKLLAEYQDVNNTSEVVSGVTVIINANGHKFYNITDKATIDTIYNNTGEAWYYGIDTTNERVFLPRSTRFKNAQSVGDVGEYQEAGLPNITGRTEIYIDSGISQFRTTGEGAMSNNPYSGTCGYNDTVWTRIAGTYGVNFNASLSNPIYSDDVDTVEYSSTKLLAYMVVGNTAQESTIIDVVDVTTTENDTVPLFYGTYFNYTPNNPSWLLGGGQENSADVYTTAYNELVNVLNGETKYGALKVIDMSNMQSGVDYSEYWKVNQDDEYFIAPIRIDGRILIAKKEPTSIDPTWYNLYSDGWCEQGGQVAISSTGITTVYLVKEFKNTDYTAFKNYGSEKSTATSDYEVSIFNQTINSFDWRNDATDTQTASWKAVGYTEVPTISEYTEPLRMYFKVANAVENLELLDAGEVMEALVIKADTDLTNITNSAKTIMSTMAMPSKSYINLTIGASGTSYTAPENGWFCAKMSPANTNNAVYLENTTAHMATTGTSGSSYYTQDVFIPATRGDIIRLDYLNVANFNYFRFIYAQGSESEV